MTNPSGYSGNKFICKIVVLGEEVEIYGCFEKDTPEDRYEYFDLYVDGLCINLGEPIYAEGKSKDWHPGVKDIEPFVELRTELLR